MQQKGAPQADQVYALVSAWPVEIHYLDEEQCLIASRYKATYSMSLADAMIAASARSLQATLMHKDPEFEPLAQEIDLLSLPYKKRSC